MKSILPPSSSTGFSTSKKSFFSVLAAVSLAASSSHLHAASDTWQGAAGTQPWNASGNWVGGNIPGSTSNTTTIDDATFNGTLGGASAITIDANRNIRNIQFTSTTLSYTLGSAGANGGNALLITNNGVVGINSNIVGAVAQTVNAPLIFQGTVGELRSDSGNATAVMTYNGDISYAGSSAMTLGLKGRNTGANTVTGVISDGGGGGTLSINRVAQNTTVWVLSGNNTYTGSTTNAGGQLRAGSTQAFGVNSAVVLGATNAGVTANLDLNSFSNSIGSLETTASPLSNGSVTLGSGTLTINGTNASAVDFKGAISGTGGVTKSGSGIQAFSGANTYTGATAVNAGTLLINSTNTGSAVTVSNANTVLGGTGTITPGASKALTVNSGAILSPGVTGTAGTLTVALGNAGDSASFASGAKFAFDLAAPGTNDVLAFTGLTLNVADVAFNSNAVNFNNLGGLAEGTYTLFTFSANNAFSGTLTIGTGLESYAGSSFSYNANSIVLNVVPEPATWALLATSLTVVLAFRRRRNTSR